MQTFLDSPYFSEMVEISAELGITGWFEGSAGNLSILLSGHEVRDYLSGASLGQRVVLEPAVPGLDGRYLLITASGARIKRVAKVPEETLGLLEIVDNGTAWRLVWGFSTDASPSSELMTHLVAHEARLAETGNSFALLHCHPPYSIAMSFTSYANGRDFSRMIWGYHAEGVAVFPEGIGVVPLTLPGGDVLAKRTAELIKKHRLIVWAKHGVISCGSSLDEAMRLVEYAEKILQIAQIACDYRWLIQPSNHLHSFLNTTAITPKELEDLARHFGVNGEYFEGIWQRGSF